MKILFICGSLEPGKDGVGDYTRRLCGELIRIGNEAHILSLCDYQVDTLMSDYQEIEGNKIVVNRIPISTSNNQRFIWIQEILNEFQPEWISFQFVPYSFNSKGLPFWLPSFLKKLKGNHKWHIMFHELWIGMDLKTTFKSSAIGLLQKGLVSAILNEKIKINTQTDLYQYKIASLGYNAQILPLFSNIIKKNESNFNKNMNLFELKFCIFGSIHYGAPVAKFIDELKLVLLGLNEKRPLKFIFIGHCGVGIEKWKQVLMANNINFEVTGFLTDKEISDTLLSCQYGISTTPYILNQKSGSLAAMYDHELSVLCVARNWTVKGFNQKPFLNLVNYENKQSIIDFLNRKFIVTNENNLECVAIKFLEGLY